MRNIVRNRKRTLNSSHGGSEQKWTLSTNFDVASLLIADTKGGNSSEATDGFYEAINMPVICGHCQQTSAKRRGRLNSPSESRKGSVDESSSGGCVGVGGYVTMAVTAESLNTTSVRGGAHFNS